MPWPVSPLGGKTPDWRAVCGKSACPVRREGASKPIGASYPYLGSLSFRRSRCGRHNCPACLSGAQHQSHVLYGRHSGRRLAVYVPEDLVPEVRRAVGNGHTLQDLLVQAGPRYVKALKRARASAAKSKNNKKS